MYLVLASSVPSSGERGNRRIFIIRSILQLVVVFLSIPTTHTFFMALYIYS